MILSLVASLLLGRVSPLRHLKVIWIDPRSTAYQKGLRKGDEVADPAVSLARLYFR